MRILSDVKNFQFIHVQAGIFSIEAENRTYEATNRTLIPIIRTNMQILWNKRQFLKIGKRANASTLCERWAFIRSQIKYYELVYYTCVSNEMHPSSHIWNKLFIKNLSSRQFHTPFKIISHPFSTNREIRFNLCSFYLCIISSSCFRHWIWSGFCSIINSSMTLSDKLDLWHCVYCKNMQWIF